MRAAKRNPLPSGQIEVTYEGAPSPRELLENVVIQAKAALKGLQTQQEIKEVTEQELRLSKESAEQMRRDRQQASRPRENEELRIFW